MTGGTGVLLQTVQRHVDAVLDLLWKRRECLISGAGKLDFIGHRQGPASGASPTRYELFIGVGEDTLSLGHVDAILGLLYGLFKKLEVLHRDDGGEIPTMTAHN